jgi:hypothetical protein
MTLHYVLNGKNQSMPLMMVKNLTPSQNNKDREIANALLLKYPWLHLNHPKLVMLLRS